VVQRCDVELDSEGETEDPTCVLINRSSHSAARAHVHTHSFVVVVVVVVVANTYQRQTMDDEMLDHLGGFRAVVPRYMRPAS
jgi:hypothetical protein